MPRRLQERTIHANWVLTSDLRAQPVMTQVLGARGTRFNRPSGVPLRQLQSARPSARQMEEPVSPTRKGAASTANLVSHSVTPSRAALACPPRGLSSSTRFALHLSVQFHMHLLGAYMFRSFETSVHDFSIAESIN